MIWTVISKHGRVRSTHGRRAQAIAAGSLVRPCLITVCWQTERPQWTDYCRDYDAPRATAEANGTPLDAYI